jgi:hypothetical protein
VEGEGVDECEMPSVEILKKITVRLFAESAVGIKNINKSKRLTHPFAPAAAMPYFPTETYERIRCSAPLLPLPRVVYNPPMRCQGLPMFIIKLHDILKARSKSCPRPVTYR